VRIVAIRLGLTLLYNTAVAFGFTFMGVNDLRSSLVYSHAIGLSIFVLARVLRRRQDPPGRGWPLAVAVPIGTVAGVTIASLLLGIDLGRQVSDHPRVIATVLGGALVFGSAASYYFHARTAAVVAEGRIREQAMQRVVDEQRLTAANLKLLQAQIEPHFLFNTLSNVIHLIDASPSQARQMLVNLTTYLRASLQRTRAGETSLGEELDLVRAYLEIQSVRMGERLTYRIDAPAELLANALPPLLIQPLVENAVRHGLEPKPVGGQVDVSARRQGDMLVLRVRDTGLGIDEKAPPGVGLANVRERVMAVSAGAGSLVIQPNDPTGVVVQVSLPIARGPDAHASPAEPA
jgi:LytS/YehU family sensor histidine kinase